MTDKSGLKQEFHRRIRERMVRKQKPKSLTKRKEARIRYIGERRYVTMVNTDA
jgi:hypothetical protein